LTEARTLRKAYTERQAREQLLNDGLSSIRASSAPVVLEPVKELKGYGREEQEEEVRRICQPIAEK